MVGDVVGASRSAAEEKERLNLLDDTTPMTVQSLDSNGGGGGGISFNQQPALVATSSVGSERDAIVGTKGDYVTQVDEDDQFLEKDVSTHHGFHGGAGGNLATEYRPGASLEMEKSGFRAKKRTCYDVYVAPYMNKGDLSNLFTFTFMLIGIWLEVHALDEEERKKNFVLAFGLFGFAGGFTNWMAIQMLFEKVCGLPGSGVIPGRFREIREVVKATIFKAFFDDEFLYSYVDTRLPELVQKLDLASKVTSMVENPEFDSKLKNKLEEISATPDGAMLLMMKGMFGGSFDQLVPMVKPTIVALARDLGENVDVRSFVSVPAIKHEIDLLMTDKLQLLTPQLVKRLIEEMIRQHLGWLIVWGNVFGGLIGIASLAIRLWAEQ